MLRADISLEAGTMLYDHPAPQPTELSDAEIEAVDQSMCGARELPIPFARAILAAQRSKS